MPKYRQFWCFFYIFLKPAFLCRICVRYIGNLLINRRYIDDISPILSDFFRFFQKKRLSFTKIVSGWLDTRNIDDISSIFRDIFVHSSFYSFEATVLRVLLKLESSNLEHQNSRYVLNNRDCSIFKTEPVTGL